MLGAPTLIIVSVTDTTRDTVGGAIQTKTKIVLSPGAQGLTVGSMGGSATSGTSTTESGVNSQQQNLRIGWREVRNFVVKTN